MEPYDDNRYVELCEQLRSAINGILDMEGNDEELVRDEVDNVLGDR